MTLLLSLILTPFRLHLERLLDEDKYIWLAVLKVFLAVLCSLLVLPKLVYYNYLLNLIMELFFNKKFLIDILQVLHLLSSDVFHGIEIPWLCVVLAGCQFCLIKVGLLPSNSCPFILPSNSCPFILPSNSCPFTFPYFFNLCLTKVAKLQLISKYSPKPHITRLFQSVQPDSSSPTQGFNHITPISRPIYFLLLGGVLVGLNHLKKNPWHCESLYGVQICSPRSFELAFITVKGKLLLKRI